MKLRTEQPSDQVMKYFTPDLFLRFNSADDEVATCADDEWETALQEYKSHLKSLGNQLPKDAKELAALCLHDAEIVETDQIDTEELFPTALRSPLKFGVGVISVRLPDEAVSLTYLLWDQISKNLPGKNWPASKGPLLWLYDEVDAIHRGLCIHRLLLSDGSLMTIPFAKVVLQRIPLKSERRNGKRA